MRSLLSREAWNVSCAGPNAVAGNGGSAKVRRMDEKLKSRPRRFVKRIKTLRVTSLGVGTGKTSWINFRGSEADFQDAMGLFRTFRTRFAGEQRKSAKPLTLAVL